MNKVLVVIPYCKEGAQGREIEYAIAGWRKHFKENFTLVVVGDYAPGADVYVYCPRIEHKDDGNYLPHLDHVHKFLKVLQVFPQVDGFIYACDDMYAVKDFTLADVKQLKYLDNDIGGDMLSGNGWERDSAKTRNLCLSHGIAIRNYVCHLPVYYEKKKLLAIYDKYDCEHNSCIVEDVYFNTYHAGETADQVYKWRFGLNSQVPKSEIEWAIGNKTWIINSPLGWSDDLDSILNEYYNGR